MSTTSGPFGHRESVRSQRTLRNVVIAVCAALVVAIAVRIWAVAWMDSLWYASVGASDVFTTRYGTQVLLAIVFCLVYFAASAISLLIAERYCPSLVFDETGNEFLDRYHQIVGIRQRRWIVALSGGLALLAGLPAAARWQDWLLLTHGSAVGIRDPQFGLDLSYYLFSLPFVKYLLGWVVALFGTVLVSTAGIYYLNGGIHWSASSGLRVLPRARAHISVIAAVLAVSKGIEYYFVDRPSLAFAQNKVFDGAGYTAVNAKLPALMFLVLVSCFCGVLLIVNVWRGGVSLPLVAGGLWLVVALLAGNVYPGLVQRFQVDPQKAKKEIDFITRNQRATMSAYGLDSEIRVEPLDVTPASTASSVGSAQETLSRLPVLDPTLLTTTFQRLKGENVLEFNSVDLDRYEIEGVSRPVNIAVRNQSVTDIPQGRSWEQLHLVYTHGSGIEAAPADAPTSEGRPDFIDSSSTEARNAGLELDRPEIYFNETFANWYAIVNSNRKSWDDTKFEATTGIKLDNIWRRVALAVGSGDVDPVLSSYLDGNSQLLLRRSVRERVATVAPFLSIGNDPYPVVVEGRLVFVVEGFTSATTYPYAQFQTSDELGDAVGPEVKTFNYIRNSVKATVDAYDGSVHLYRIDTMSGPSDPILDTWSRVFPDLFESTSEMPVGLINHLRYPDELLRIQSRILGRYHVSDPETFYDGAKNWIIATDPGTEVRKNPNDGTASRVPVGASKPTPPVSMFLKLPNDETFSFVRLLPFIPGSDGTSSRAELTGFLVANQSPESYGDLTLFELTSVDSRGTRQSGAEVAGPTTVQVVIESDVSISQGISLLNTNGSKIQYGATTLVPVNNSILWVRPLYVTGSGGTESFPTLRKVIVVSGGKAVMADSLSDATTRLFGASGEGADDDPVDEAPVDESEDATTLLIDAGRLLDEGQAALGEKDGLATYQKNQDLAREKIDEALAILEALPTSGASNPTTSSVPAATSIPAVTSVPAATADPTTSSPTTVAVGSGDAGQVSSTTSIPSVSTAKPEGG